MKWRVACFDIDGTLVTGTSVCQHLGDSLGHAEVIEELERRYASGEITNRHVAERLAEYYRDRSLLEIAESLESVPLIKGIAETFSVLRQNGLRILLATVTWSFAARIIAQRFELDGWSGCEMGESKDLRLSGTVQRHFDEFDKRAFVESYCAQHGIAMSDVVAVGDSRSDIPLFECVGCSIAINATELARKAASCSLDTNNLTDILRIVPGLEGRITSG